MNKTLSTLAMLSALGAASLASAATFSPTFSDYSFPGTQFTVDAAANSFFSAQYGITINNAYLYKDVRDIFDGIGIANGTVANNNVPGQIGRIDFLDLTDFVTIDYLAVRSTTYSAYNSSGAQISTFTSSSSNGTNTLSSVGTDYISYLLFTTDGGYGAVSNLTYNYDGTTGGGNIDLPPPVPEPETYALMIVGLAAISWAARRRGR